MKLNLTTKEKNRIRRMHLTESLNPTSTLLTEAGFSRDMVDMDRLMDISNDVISNKDPNALDAIDLDKLIECLISVGYTPAEVTGALFVMHTILEDFREVGDPDFPEDESTLEALFLLYAIANHVDNEDAVLSEEIPCFIETIEKMGYTIEEFMAI